MIVITGASDGLGKEVAKLYQEVGAKVVNISRRESEYADINICLSLREGPEIKQAAEQVLALEEPLESLVNCAGVFSSEVLGEITEDEVKRLMSTNVKPLILLVSELYERILQDKTDIVNVSSTAGTKGYVGQLVYSASKWAARGVSKSLQEDFKDKPNRVISFCPGGFKSKLFEKATGTHFEHDESWMNPKDLAATIKHALDLPKNIEVSEIILNRNKV